MTQSSETLTGTWVDLIGFTDTSTSGKNGTFRWETCYNGSNKGIHWHDNATNAFVNGSHKHITQHDRWTHCCVVFNNITKKIYSYDNGILTATHTHLGGSFNSTGTFYLGQNNVIEGMVQDVRIYDHALSNKEVEEISKGLILHYKLDGTSCPNKNLFKLNSIDNSWNIYKPSDYCAYGLALTEKLELNQPYTIQLWDVDVSHTGKTEAQLGLGIYLGGGYNGLHTWLGSQYFTNGHADYLFITFIKTSWARPADAEKLWLNIYNSPGNATGTRYMHIGAWKIEKGEIPTGWNGEENICYDSSGYNNDGTIVGSLIAVADSARYNCATYFNGSSAVAVGNKCKIKDAITVSCWAQMDNWGNYTGRLLSCTEGGGWNFQPASGKIRFAYGIGTSSNTYYRATSTTTLSSLGNSWHFFVGTYDGLSGKIYIDGKLEGTTNSSTTRTPLWYHSSNGIFVGAESSGNTTTPEKGAYFTGKISDARIYATALTEAQIQELYNTSATIDDLGNTYARELVE